MRFVSYFDYVHYDPVVPALTDGRDTKRPTVTIVGGGPIGFSLALGLARYGIPSVVIEADDSVCTGSRAGCVTRRTLEIFEQLDMAAPVMRQGLPWSEGWSYHRTTPVLHLELPDDGLARYPQMLNIQQCYVEQYLLDAIEDHERMVEVRWQNRVTDVVANADGVELGIETPCGAYRMNSDWVVACDGARSTVRKALGLRLAGSQYESHYVIVDIKLKSDLAPGRRAWFDPPSNPGATLLLHKHRDDLWRFDYQLREGEDPEDAVKPENVLARVQSHLTLMGETGPWDPVWISLYKASSLTLEAYRHGRVFFAGDAAHLVPIFGVRGMNSGIEDAHNLAWKLAFFLQGRADERLLDSYSAERVFATRENMRHASKSAEFMAPPSPAFKLMRGAVLSLAERHDWIRSLINPRQSTAVGYPVSPLNPPAGSDAAAPGPAPGDVPSDAPLYPLAGGTATHLSSLLGPHFTLFCFAATGRIDPRLAETVNMLNHEVPIRACVIAGPDAEPGPLSLFVDQGERAAKKLGVADGAVVLARPDGNVLGCWHAADPAGMRNLLATCRAGGA